jgi:rubrerythrin
MPNSLDRYAYVALGKAARAARTWAEHERKEEPLSTHATSEDTSYRDVVEQLMIATRALHRVDLSTEQPERPHEMRFLLKRPVRDWLGAGRSEPLLIRHGRRVEITGYAELILSETGDSPEREEAQRHVGRVKEQLRARYEEAGAEEKRRVEATYRQFRRGLIECSLPTFEEATELTSGVKATISQLFTQVEDRRLTRFDGSEGAFPCPLCGYPMEAYRQEDRVACSSVRCQRQGAQFSWTVDDEMPVSLSGELSGERATFVSTEERERCQVRRGIWVSTVLPGLVEVDLHERLSEHAEVQLWPKVDRYDLHVSAGEDAWRVDVKDWHRADQLSDRLSSNVPAQTTWIVVPDDRDHQVEFLRHSDLPRIYQFASASDLVDEVSTLSPNA